MNQIQLPSIGITLLPPWWCFILWSDKRIENRAASVGGRLRGWTGLIALTASKAPEGDDWHSALHDWRETKERLIASDEFTWTRLQRDGAINLGEMKAAGGHVVGVAELIGVQDNDRVPPTKWAVPGQRGLLLNRVWEVEPVPCSGGRGVFRFGGCPACGKLGAVETKTQPLMCRACKTSTPFDLLVRPMLNVIAVRDKNGRVGEALGDAT